MPGMPTHFSIIFQAIISSWSKVDMHLLMWGSLSQKGNPLFFIETEILSSSLSMET